MSERVEALVKRELLIWARETARFTVEQASKKLQLKPERLQSWERGDAIPTIKQLRKLGKVYKRPLAIFFLPVPPRDFDAMHDFRRLPGELVGVQTPELTFQIRQAHSRREFTTELYAAVESEPPPLFTIEANVSDDPEQLSGVLRQALGISYEDQTEWAAGYQTFNILRKILEGVGVLVFQAINVELREARGFSISEKPFPAVVVNIKDTPRGRCFTMFHELTHILLHDGGLCDLSEEPDGASEEQRIEIFCNHVAGATLVPRDYLLREEMVRQKRNSSEWSDRELRLLADRYSVSREVLLRRLLICNRTTESFYRRKRDEFQQEYTAQGAQRSGGFVPPHVVAISSAGRFFTRLVLNNYHQENITVSEVSDLLGVRLKHLPKIENDVMG